MKDWLVQQFRKLVALYRLNSKFHAFVVAVEFAVVGFFTTYQGGIPATHDAWSAFVSGLVGAIWGAAKGWIRANVTQPDPPVPAPPLAPPKDH